MRASLSRPTRPTTLSVATFFLALAVFAAGVFFYTRHNDFPVLYHPDEYGKVFQVLSGKSNFHHPQLMLTFSRVAWRATTHLADTYLFEPGDIVVAIGRTISACFMSAAVVLLSLTALRRHGPVAAVVVALIAMLSSGSVVAAHYFKEDAALAFGLCAWLYALTRHEAKSTRLTLLLLGIAAGLACSAKYVGFITIPLTWAVLLPRSTDTGRRWVASLRRDAGFTVAAAAVFVLMNLPAFVSPGTFRSGLTREVRHVATSHMALRNWPLDPQPLGWITSDLTWLGMGLALVGLAVGFAHWPRLSRVGRLLLVLPALLMAMFQMSSYHVPRYFLPVTLMLAYHAGVGAVTLIGWLSRPSPGVAWRSACNAAVVALVCVVTLRGGLLSLSDFANDSRNELHAWLFQNIEPGSVVMQEAAAGLPTAAPETLGIHISQKNVALVNRSLTELRDQGVQYLIICDSSYGRYFNPHTIAVRKPREDMDLLRPRRRYQYLLDQTPLWSSTRRPGNHDLASPSVSVYLLTEELVRGEPGPDSSIPMPDHDQASMEH